MMKKSITSCVSAIKAADVSHMNNEVAIIEVI